MIVHWKILILTFPSALLLLAACLGTGEIVYRGVSLAAGKRNHIHTPAAVFWKLITGFFILAAVYAAFVTGLRTSLLPVPLLAAALLIADLPSTDSARNYKNHGALYSPWLFLLIGVFLYWLFFALHFILSVDGQTSFIGYDTLYYGRVADHLNASGWENVTLSYTDSEGRGVEPYHYGDIWMIALVQQFTGVAPALVTPLIIYPALAAIFCFGLIAYLSPSGEGKHPNLYWLVLFAGLVSGFAFLYPSGLFPGSQSLSFALLSVPKLFFVGIILIGILLSLQNKSWNRCILISVIGSIMFINIAPAILSTLAILLLFAKFIRGESLSLKPVAIVIATMGLIYYFSFYQLFPSTEIPWGDQPFRLQKSINILGAGIFQFFPLLPFLLLLLIYWFNLKKIKPGLRFTNDILFLVTVAIAGLGSWALMYAISPEAIQFFYNILVPVSAIIICLVVMKISQGIRSKWMISVVFLYLFSVYLNLKSAWAPSRVNSQDREALIDFIEKHRPGSFVNLRSHHEFKSINDRNTQFTHPLSYLNYQYLSYNNISLNTPFLPIDTSSVHAGYERIMLASTPFSQYIKKRDTLVPMQDYAYLFIIERRIQYLAVSPDTVLPYNLQQLVKDSIRLRDGWYIYYIEK